MRWDELTREELKELLPEAVVVVPTGATEQHGPYLPTGTDAMSVTAVVERATQGDFPRPVIVTPTVSVGSSDHHFPFGGTLSLSSETYIAVIMDLARSIVTGGGRRMVLVNGHGGNQGPNMTAAAAATNTYEIAVAIANYWDLLPPLTDGPPVPGHAGGFEIGMMHALRPELVRPVPHRELPAPFVEPAGFTVFTGSYWHDMNGHTDSGENVTPEQGREWLETIVAALTDRLTELARTL
ncbi:MAG TPA: creatininase family protein [Mycobacteriales bacterium]|nr:creatininase family protein [Mycobacteriales bacterium]